MRAFVLLALFWLVLPGCLDVDAADGTLICSTVTGRECPRGWYCLEPNHTCWRNGHGPRDMAHPPPVHDLATGARDLSVPVEPLDLAPAPPTD
jgi:hypothetical protein